MVLDRSSAVSLLRSRYGLCMHEWSRLCGACCLGSTRRGRWPECIAARRSHSSPAGRFNEDLYFFWKFGLFSFSWSGNGMQVIGPQAWPL